MSAVASLVERYRLTEYTGENRCLPCTTVNVVIALAVAVGLAVVATPPVGVLALGVSILAIWLRGYLVPGTPALTKRYLPDPVLRLFEKAPDLPDPGETVDVEAYLTEVEAVRDAGDDVELTTGFESAWRAAIDDVRTDPAAAAGDVLSLADPGVETRGEATVVTDGGTAAADWPSEAALLSDLGAVEVLESRDSAWQERGHGERGRILAGLRIFLERCPECGGTPELDEDVVESCCRQAQVFTYACPDCDARLLEVEQ